MPQSDENRFNLVHERWVPIAGKERVSLEELFLDTSLPGFGGNAIEKISLLKLTLAIAQAACTPEDDGAWRSIGPDGVAVRAVAYLSEHEKDFWLYGKHPFLQMPAIASAEKVPYGALQPMIATGNTTVLFQSQIERSYSDEELALLLVTLMNFAHGGKKTDNSIVLSPGYQGKTSDKGKPSTGKSGPALGYYGYLHSFLVGKILRETIWLNLLTLEDIKGMPFLSEGLGRPTWERMPAGEDDSLARKSRESYLGRLVPLSRFVLFDVDGIHYSEGISFPSHLEGAQDPSVAVSSTAGRHALWTNPDQRPWRQLPALLSFFDATSNDSFDCRLMRVAIPRASIQVPFFSLWSGGLRVHVAMGEQNVRGLDDFVESEVLLSSSWLDKSWFQKLKLEMEALKTLSKSLYGSIASYFKGLKADGTEVAAKASDSFWKTCEGIFQELVDACGSATGEDLAAIRKHFALFAEECYDLVCPRASARQIEAWAAHRLSTYRYLNSSGGGKPATAEVVKREARKNKKQ